MAERLQADLDLDISGAIRSVEELSAEVQSQLSDAIDSFSDAYAAAIEGLPAIEPTIDAGEIAPEIEAAVEGADATVEPTTDAAGITGEIEGAVEGADAEVTIEADVSGIEDEIADAVADVDVEPIEISLGIDTGDAESDVEDLAGAAGEAGESLQFAEKGASGFSAAGSVASGSASGLAAALTTMGGVGGFAGALILATAGAASIFVAEATDALGATQRFESALGPLADRVEKLTDVRHLTGLNLTLGELALKLGSDDDKIRTTVARLFELATASGVSKDKASLFVQEMVALAANAVALNPALGDVGDVTNNMVSAFVRGGKRAADLGINLSRAEIETRALKDTGKATAAELSIVDKAMAGAAIAAERYGTNIATNVAAGAENAITVQRRLKQTIIETFESLGAPLVVPVFDLMEEAIPIVKDLGTIFGTIAAEALPALIAVLKVLGPTIGFVADIIDDFGPLLPIIVDAFIAWKIASLGLAAVQGILALATGAVTISMAGFGATAEVAAASAATAGLTMQAAVPAIAAFTAAFVATSYVLNRIKGDSEDLTDELDKVETAIGHLTAVSDQNLVPAFQKAVKAQRELLRAAQDNDDVVQATGKTIRSVGVEYALFNDVVKSNIGTAARLLETYRDQPEVYERLKAKLDAAIASQQQQNADQATATALLNAHTDAVNDLSGTISTTVPTAGDAWNSYAEDVRAAFGPEAEGSIQGFVDRLQESVNEVETWQNNIKFFTGAGLTGIAALIQQQGPGTSLIEELRNTDPELHKQWDASLRTNTIKLVQMKAEAEVLSTRVAEAILSGMASTPENVERVMQQTQTEIENKRNPIADAGFAAGDAGQGAFGFGIGGMPGQAGNALRGVEGVMNQGASILGSPARIAGLVVGGQFADGLANGIYMGTRAVEFAAAELVRRAEAAAREEARSGSPSKLFAELGEDLTAGVSVGMEKAVPDVVVEAEDLVRSAWLAARSVPVPPAATTLGGGPTMTTSSYDHSVNVYGGIHNHGPGPDSRGAATMRKLRTAQWLAVT